MIRRAWMALLTLCATVVASHAADEAFCSLWSREATRIGLAAAADVDLATATPDLIKFSLSRNFTTCLNADEAPALPATILASDSAWLEMVARNIRDRLGEKPADSAKVATLASKYDPAKLAKCRRQFRSFDPKTATVIPYHHKRRVLCPLL